jgi:mannose-binding lectin 1
MARPVDEPTTGSKAPPFTSHPSSGNQAPVENNAQLSQILTLLQSLTSTVADLKTEVDTIKSKLDSQASELKSAVMDVPTHFPFESLSEVSRKTNTIESTVLQIRRDVEGRDYKEHLTGLQAALQDTRESLLSGLPVSLSKSKSNISLFERTLLISL